MNWQHLQTSTGLHLALQSTLSKQVPRPEIGLVQIMDFATSQRFDMGKLYNLSELQSFTLCQTGLVMVPASWV